MNYGNDGKRSERSHKIINTFSSSILKYHMKIVGRSRNVNKKKHKVSRM